MSGYTIGEIVVWLVLAAGLGFALGWLLRELKCRSEHGAGTVVAADEQPVTVSAPTVEPTDSAGSTEVAPAKKASAKKAPAKKAPANKAPAKKTPATKTPATKAAVRKAGAKKAPAKRTPAKKAVAKKAVAKKAGAKKAAAKKAAAITPGRFPGSARPLSGGRPPSASYTIKGNEDSMIYHSPESPSYSQTTAETWFKSEDDAVAAGFRKPRNM